jgi:hypothetical protein
VNGSAIFTKAVVKLYASWPDYVFKKSYRLPALTDIESFIKLHHHLQGVPEAEEIQRTGIDLGASQTMLLKKIEELTLYVIEQNKQIATLQNRIEKLEKNK